MYEKQPKKILILNILDILRKYTDEDHRLSQKEISDILRDKYDMKADRKAIRRNLLNLMDCGYDIEYSETIRNVPEIKRPVNPLWTARQGSQLWRKMNCGRIFI